MGFAQTEPKGNHSFDEVNLVDCIASNIATGDTTARRSFALQPDIACDYTFLRT
ncbi:uncharacterized protein PHALS_10541 [Plasmopara halstedii]|uniref:Uncharacterized protein n=1 Tax=Plasmopara halstedii TaxID=4781 RepID=A0A0P1AIK4_PLAHL|nr:uncharacterized protein PHALS_10541 [Plasmopara halstedii]CEG40337.1 hypothetical protein PHALS_10541 [Plasmopara halstedii]|eukprot:XP_024576706.1 hypothetical protein PHALS_10541 [Plasmopara halstedii]